MFAAAGIKLYAISYDELDALREFSEHHGITFDLLADRGSKVIRQYGILNHHVTEEQVPFHGVPFPGTYLVDEDGIVTAKAFHSNLAQRESPEGLIDAALGEILLRSEEPTATEQDGDGIRFSVTYHGGGGAIRIGQVRRLVVRVDLPDGIHIYDDPVPEGMQAARFRLAGPTGLRSLPVEKPPTEALELPGAGELRVWSGQVDFVIPVWAASEITELVGGDLEEVTVEIDIDYQACDDRACRLPRAARVRLAVPVALSMGHRSGSGEKMDTQRWMSAMVSRSLASTSEPDAAIEFLDDMARHLSRTRREAKPGDPHAAKGEP